MINYIISFLICKILLHLKLIIKFIIFFNQMKTKYTYYNTSMLVLHEYNLQKKSLFDLYILRNKIILNNNYIVKKLNLKVVDIIDNVIKHFDRGRDLIDIVNENIVLCTTIENNTHYNIDDNFDLLKLYKNINRLEKIFDFEKDSLLTYTQIENRLQFQCKKFIHNIKNKLLLCKWNIQ